MAGYDSAKGGNAKRSMEFFKKSEKVLCLLLLYPVNQCHSLAELIKTLVFALNLPSIPSISIVIILAKK